MKIECFIVSTNYTDILELVLPENRWHFDNTVIATVKNDFETQELCRKNGVECVLVDEYLYKDGAPFNRGSSYNYLLNNRVKYHEFICFLDSDILLNPNFRQEMRKIQDQIEMFWGIRRYDIPTYEDYIKAKSFNKEELSKYTLFRGFGFGFFQCFHYKSQVFQKLLKETNGHPYPEFPTSAECDWRFRGNYGDMVYQPDFDVNQHSEENVKDYGSGLLKELKDSPCLHLGLPGFNNSSRVTERFV